MLFTTFGKLDSYLTPLEEEKLTFYETFHLPELLLDQDKIDKIILHKLKRQDNTFVHLIDADQRQRFLLHKDNWPFYVQRMKLWSSYL